MKEKIFKSGIGREHIQKKQSTTNNRGSTSAKRRTIQESFKEI
jgi:hypothetical protein